MSSGWSWWVIGLTVFNMAVIFFLFLWAPWAKVPTLPDGTTGHSWAHGEIKEGMHPLPKWWIVMSFLLFMSAFTYLALYPGFGKSKGIYGWTAQGELAKNQLKNDAKLDPLMSRLTTVSVEKGAADNEIKELGHRLFQDNCAACHGQTATGNQTVGAPNLRDADWLYGGTADNMVTSIQNGRTGGMPAWESLGDEKIKNLTEYVRDIGGLLHDDAASRAGEPVFKSTCAACHGADGKGNTMLGAPNLTDAVWLYGGSKEAVEYTIRHGRQGKMPAWKGRLADSEIKAIASYVYSFSGGQSGAKQ